MNLREASCSVSVVIPLHNKADHVERAIRSVLSQTLKPREIFVVDDASTDGGAQLVEKFRDDNVQILTRDTPGPGGYAARNLAIQNATADWIAFLDADDAWCDDHLETVWAAILGSGAGVTMVATRFSEQHPGGITKPDILTKRLGAHTELRLEAEQFLILWKRLDECPVWTSAIVARRSALLDAGLFPERCRRGGDKDLWLRLSLRGDVIILPRSTAIYHKDASNMVTRLRHGNMRHCICASVGEAMEKASPAVQRLLRDVRDIENYRYAILTSRFSTLERGWWQDFQFTKFPLRAASMFFLSTGVGHATFRILHRARRSFRNTAGPTN
jgi:glycosyltransferase involved in cell wall biosynthesis